jgi:nucleoside-diphosphate-sugar epimerase
MDKGMFVPKFFEWALQNEVIHTHCYLNGMPSSDFLYIDDLVDAIRLALEARDVFPVHLGTGVATTTKPRATDCETHSLFVSD